MAEMTKMPFGLWTRVGPKNQVLDSIQIPGCKRQFWAGRGNLL